MKRILIFVCCFMLAMPLLVIADDYTFTGSNIVLTGLNPGTTFSNVVINGATIETGTGTKSPDNIYSINGVYNPTITVTNGTNLVTYPVSTSTPLYSLSDGTVDKTNVTSGLETHNIGKVLYDGSPDENWSLVGINSYNICNFTLVLSGKYITSVGFDMNAICNYFNMQNTLQGNTQTEGIALYQQATGSVDLYFRISSTRLSTLDVSGLKAWLADNNIMLLYKLATPIITQITPLDISAYSPNTTILIDKGTMTATYIPGVVVPEDPNNLESDENTIFVLQFCVYCFACILVTFTALHFILGFCRTGLYLMTGLPFQRFKGIQNRKVSDKYN